MPDSVYAPHERRKVYRSKLSRQEFSEKSVCIVKGDEEHNICLDTWMRRFSNKYGTR